MRTGIFKLILAFSLVFQTSVSYANKPVQLAIVIDDIGNSKLDLKALALPTAITLSVLPYTPYAKRISNIATQQGRELLLHVPMQAKTQNSKLGKGALMYDMQEQQFKDQLNNAINYLPDATGINNHMGSMLTEHVMQMQWIMETLDKHGLYFLDSRTTPLTIAENTANISGIPALRRHIFLDNIKTEKAMEQQFQHAINLGKKNASVVIIAHPYPETIQFLEDKFQQKNSAIQLVALLELLSQNERLAMTKKRNELRQVNNVSITDIVTIQTKQAQ